MLPNVTQMLPITFVKRCPKMSYKYIAKNPPVKVGSLSRNWVFSSLCPRPDLNRHGLFSQRILSPSDWQNYSEDNLVSFGLCYPIITQNYSLFVSCFQSIALILRLELNDRTLSLFYYWNGR